eukprot:CAMPEP_0181454078 /NCGR_PEP_ID=MMETSP1110-20121109/30052_1 /TAXON_ID=174948 /ORGANISM="Symbiodinium sp., Strain CCMP421" /LENGTH=261 /DNA_ID=CAMNT_0023578411 /DNA_START=161 /DNA_END=944 /DNA_ORIENTATION=+
MESLIKCAGCGKKPGVKAKGQRNSWTAVCNQPCNERGGPRYDMDDGKANSAFTSGLRACANESDEAAARRERAGSKDRPMGPERFFYDKSSYTGTHANGGPDHVAKGLGTSRDQTWKRPSQEMDDLARVTLLSGQAPSPMKHEMLPDVLPYGPPAQAPVGARALAAPASAGPLLGARHGLWDRSASSTTGAPTPAAIRRAGPAPWRRVAAPPSTSPGSGRTTEATDARRICVRCVAWPEPGGDVFHPPLLRSPPKQQQTPW